MLNGLSLLLIILLLTGCSSSTTVIAKYQPVVKFNELQSYGLYHREDKFNDWQALSDATRNGVELAIEQAMDKLGFELKGAEQADVVVTYYLIKQDSRSLVAYNQGVNYCSYCLKHSKSNSRKDKLSYATGSLIIDLIKPKSRRSIWRSTFPINIKDKDNSMVVSDKINHAVAVILAQLALLQTNDNDVI